MRSSKSARMREEAVDERLDDLVEQPRRMLDRLAALGEAVAYLVERRSIVAVNGDEVPLAVEAVHLDEPVLVGRGAVEDEESEVVIAVDLGALPEMLRILDRERMELEDVPENLEVRSVGLVEVEPEEAAFGKELADLLGAELDRAASPVVDDVAGARPWTRSLSCRLRCPLWTTTRQRRPRARASRCDA